MLASIRDCVISGSVRKWAGLACAGLVLLFSSSASAVDHTRCLGGAPYNVYFVPAAGSANVFPDGHKADLRTRDMGGVNYDPQTSAPVTLNPSDDQLAENGRLPPGPNGVVVVTPTAVPANVGKCKIRAIFKRDNVTPQLGPSKWSTANNWLVINLAIVEPGGGGSVTKLSIHARADYEADVTPSSEESEGVYDWSATPASLMVGTVGGDYLVQAVRASETEGTLDLTAEFTHTSATIPCNDTKAIAVVKPTGEIETCALYQKITTGEGAGEFGFFEMQIQPVDAHYGSTQVQEEMPVGEQVKDNLDIPGQPYVPSAGNTIWSVSSDGAYGPDWIGPYQSYLDARAAAGMMGDFGFSARQHMKIFDDVSSTPTKTEYTDHDSGWSIETPADAFTAWRDSSVVIEPVIP